MKVAAIENIIHTHHEHMHACIHIQVKLSNLTLYYPSLSKNIFKDNIAYWNIIPKFPLER